MDKDILDQKHPTYDAIRWRELEALAEGGKKFHALIDTFLPQNPMEPEALYVQRRKRAKYFSYTGAIINLYVAWLFAANFNVKAYKRGTKDAQDPDKFYGEFQEDVAGEVTLKAFMESRTREAMQKGKASWLIQMPPDDGEPPVDRKEYEDRKLGRASLLAIDAHELLDWECDDEGRYLWAITKTCTQDRKVPAVKRNVVIETWRVYDTESVTTFELRRERTNSGVQEDAVKLVDSPRPHGFKRVPIVTLSLPVEMCIGEQTYDPQIQHFRLDAALDWAIQRTCYALPVFKCENDETRPTMGIGYAIYLGKDEDLTWASPPSDSFTVISKERDKKREEIFRIVHQMAQSVDNNAETVGRSAESKEIDAAATRLMLNTYGDIVARAIEETYETISEARAEKDLEWSVEGFSGYDVATAGTLLANTKMAKDLGIPSNTFQQEISTKAALSLVPESDQRVKDAIRKEIQAYRFEVTGQTADMVKTDKTLDSQESISQATLKSQEQTAAASLKASAQQAKANTGAKPAKK